MPLHSMSFMADCGMDQTRNTRNPALATPQVNRI